MNKIGYEFLSNYEKAIMKGVKKSTGDLIVEDMNTKATIQRFLNTKAQLELEDGTMVFATAKEMIIASAIGDAVEKGSFDKVLTMMKTTGEAESSATEIHLSLVDKDLEDRALK